MHNAPGSLERHNNSSISDSSRSLGCSPGNPAACDKRMAAITDPMEKCAAYENNQCTAQFSTDYTSIVTEVEPHIHVHTHSIYMYIIYNETSLKHD